VPTRQLIAEVEKLPAPGQSLLLGALAERGDAAFLPVLMRASASPEPQVRLAALRAFAPVQGNAEAALLLATTIARGSSNAELAKTMARGAMNAERDAARASAATIRGAAVDEALIAAIPTAEPDVRRELVYILGQRYNKNAKPLLFNLATDEKMGAQTHAMNALGEVAGAEDYPAAVKLLLETRDNGVRGAAEGLVVRLARLVPDENQRTDTLMAGMTGASPDTRISLLKVFGALGGGASLSALRADLQHVDPKVQDAAIRALASSPDTDAMKDLLELARNTPGKAHQVLSLRGYLRLAETASQRTDAKFEEIYEPAVKVATEAQEKKTIISGLARFNSPGALAMLAPYLDDEAVRGEAALAALGIARSVAGKNPVEAKASLDKIVAVVKDEGIVNQANELLKNIKLP
jgi:HEAT repeat protein